MVTGFPPYHVESTVLVITQVPSGYYICDCFLRLDAILNNKLFRYDPKNPQKTRVSMAATEAVRVKKCLGALRYLWRNSPEASHAEAVQEMKDLLVASPLQCHRSPLPSGPPTDPPQAIDREADEHPADPASDEASESDASSEEAGDGEAFTNDVGDVESENSLTAPTLMLGDPDPSDQDGMTQYYLDYVAESQVRPEGWLGGFYHKWKDTYDADYIQKMNDGEPIRDDDDDDDVALAIGKQMLLQDIKDELARQELDTYLLIV